MDEKRIKNRGIEVKEWRRGKIRNHKLVFNKPCRYGGCANIEPCEGSEVEGVLYLIPYHDLQKLDTYEGYPHHYDRRKIIVDTEEGPIKAWVYIAARTKPGLKPSKEYMQYLVNGAKQHNLSQKHIQFLENIEILD